MHSILNRVIPVPDFHYCLFDFALGLSITCGLPLTTMLRDGILRKVKDVFTHNTYVFVVVKLSVAPRSLHYLNSETGIIPD